MAHKFNKAEFEARKQIKVNLKQDTGKKATVSALADRVVEIEKAIGIR